MLPERIRTTFVRALVNHIGSPDKALGLTATGLDGEHLYAVIWTPGKLQVAQSHPGDDRARLLKLASESEPVDLDVELGPHAHHVHMMELRIFAERCGWRPRMGFGIA
jgi:hypothetical protein